MTAMSRALMRALTDLGRPALLGLMLRTLALTVLVLLALQGIVIALIRAYAPAGFALPWIGEVSVRGWLSWGSLALLPVMGLFLMTPVATTIGGMMTDSVAGRVEALHYPANRGRDSRFGAGLIEAIGVTLAVLAVAVLALALTPVLGPAAPLFFYGANGWLLGREFFQAAAARHMPRQDAARLRRSMGGTVTATGIIIALMLTVPLLNIFVPMLAMAAFTHLYQLTAAGSGPSSARPRG